jgi:hypothetical protein
MCGRSPSYLFETEVSRFILLAIASFHGSDRLASVGSAFSVSLMNRCTHRVVISGQK